MQFDVVYIVSHVPGVTCSSRRAGCSRAFNLSEALDRPVLPGHEGASIFEHTACIALVQRLRLLV
jgi:hypothetical protein